MKKLFFSFIFLMLLQFSFFYSSINIPHQEMISSDDLEYDHFSKESRSPHIHFNLAVNKSVRIEIPDFPNAFNPSIIKVKDGFLLTFRFCPDPRQLWISWIGLVKLDESLKMIAPPQVLDTRIMFENNIHSQSEDARIFEYNDHIYIIYNDNVEYSCPSINERRDMFIAEILSENNHFFLSYPKKIIHEEKYPIQKWQKNWIPFEWNHNLLLGYSVVPHEIVYVDFITGYCTPFCETKANIDWKWGHPRGGTPAVLIDGEYLAFFHSSKKMKTILSDGNPVWHYYMGAYTFSASPPFEITKVTPYPIIANDFYHKSDAEKRVVFPGGFAVSDSTIFVAYGKDDREIWITAIDKKQLKNSMMPITSKIIKNDATNINN